MAFKTRKTASEPPSSPEQLFLKSRTASSTPDSLWPHQAQIFQTWHASHSGAKDVAIELPTGAGKTLIGGFIGEFQRQANKKRVVYLCPTRQLARQCHERLESYGISAVLLIGQVTDWNPADRARYSSGEAIAVSVYSHVFNSNPALDNSEYMILDDAHAAEGYVSKPWSIVLDRKESAYMEVLSALSDALDPLVVSRLKQDSPAGQFASDTYLASPLGVTAAAGDLERILKSAQVPADMSSDSHYALRLMQGHLGRCLVYASYRQIQIRPFIPPTHSHTAFDAPQQRLYMSATLGEGGELERSFGRQRISRIPSPKEWETKGTGRRFFMFPELTTDLSKNKAGTSPWVSNLIKQAGRAIVLTPDSRSADDFEDWIGGDHKVFHATDIEDDLSAFTNESNAVLVLTNRYDGIDLPDDDCRLVILFGLPSRGDLQERFLAGALGAMDVLQERIRSRIVQGAGRATRNSSDFAGVVMLGDDLSSFCTRKDVLNAMRPEVNAEVSFGLDNSLGFESEEMTENFQTFLAQGDAWQEVEEDLAERRSEAERAYPPGTHELSAAAREEVAAYHALWQGELDRTLDHARRVLDGLTGGRAPQRYAALWNYLAACWALLHSRNGGEETLKESSRAYFLAARSSGRGTLWLSHMAAPSERNLFQAPLTNEVDPLDAAAAQRIVEELPKIGKPSSFDDEVTRMRGQLLATEATPYEEALVFLGSLLGANSSGNGGATAAPDASWVFDSHSWIGWEAKSEAEPSGELGPVDVRQAGSHLRYIASDRQEAIPSQSLTFIMTPQERIHPASRAVAEDHVFLVRPHQVVELFDAAVAAWRKIRSRGLRVVGPDDVVAALTEADALPSTRIRRLATEPLSAQIEPSV
jgi:hypothetical protein